MLSIQRISNPSFGTKFVIGKNYLGSDEKRLENIGKKYEQLAKNSPEDTFVVNTGYIEYHKKGKTLPMNYYFSDKNNYIDGLLKYDDKTVVQKFNLLTNIAKKAFKCNDITNAYLNKIQKMTGDDTIFVTNEDDIFDIGETFAKNAVEKDAILKDLVTDVIID